MRSRSSHVRTFEDREDEIPYELVENAISFDEIMNIPTYEEAEKLLYGNDDDEETSDEEEEEDEEPKPSKKPSKHREEEEDEEEDDEEDEDEEEPAPKKPSKKSDGEASPKGKCPFGHRYGKDCDEFEDCNDCDLWEKCLKNK